MQKNKEQDLEEWKDRWMDGWQNTKLGAQNI